jgi:hypothetical protein
MKNKLRLAAAWAALAPLMAVVGLCLWVLVHPRLRWARRGTGFDFEVEDLLAPGDPLAPPRRAANAG